MNQTRHDCTRRNDVISDASDAYVTWHRCN